MLQSDDCRVQDVLAPLHDVNPAAGTSSVQLPSTTVSERLETIIWKCADNALDNIDQGLLACGIRVYQMSRKNFDKSVRDGISDKFDLVLTDRPYGVPPNPAQAGRNYIDCLDDAKFLQYSRYCKNAF